jgi:hypothetical protein
LGQQRNSGFAASTELMGRAVVSPDATPERKASLRARTKTIFHNYLYLPNNQQQLQLERSCVMSKYESETQTDQRAFAEEPPVKPKAGEAKDQSPSARDGAKAAEAAGQGNKKSMATMAGAAAVGAAGMGIGRDISLGKNVPLAAPVTEADAGAADDQPKDGDEKMSFEEAFAAARKESGPGAAFTYEGKEYSTFTKEEWDELSQEQKDSFLNHEQHPDDVTDQTETSAEQTANVTESMPGIEQGADAARQTVDVNVNVNVTVTGPDSVGVNIDGAGSPSVAVDTGTEAGTDVETDDISVQPGDDVMVDTETEVGTDVETDDVSVQPGDDVMVFDTGTEAGTDVETDDISVQPGDDVAVDTGTEAGTDVETDNISVQPDGDDAVTVLDGHEESAAVIDETGHEMQTDEHLTDGHTDEIDSLISDGTDQVEAGIEDYAMNETDLL